VVIMSQTWEAMKRAAQSVYTDIGNSYQQLLIAGHLYPPTSRDQLNHEIAEAAYDPAPAPEPEQLELFYLNHFHFHDPPQEPQQDLEPEM